MKIAIVGGSIAGLSLAWALRARGVDPRILERSAGLLEHRGTGVLLAPELPPLLNLRVRAVERRLMIGGEGRVLWEHPMRARAAGWGQLYQALRHRAGEAEILSGSPVVEVDRDPPRLLVPGRGWETFDLVVGADGLGSTVRPYLDPAFRPRYLGHVAVRGMVPRNALPPGLPPVVDDLFRDALGHVLMAGEHATLYGLPGEPEQLNWIWFRNTPALEMGRFLTDREGRRHGWSLPPGALQPEVEADLRCEASDRLPPLLARLVASTETLFLQPVFGGSAAVAHGGGLVLIGDASHLAIPHAGAGVTLALADALTLAEVLDAGLGEGLEDRLASWEEGQRRDAATHLDLAVRMGEALQSPGKDWEAWRGADFEAWWRDLVGDDRPYFEPEPG